MGLLDWFGLGSDSSSSVPSTGGSGFSLSSLLPALALGGLQTFSSYQQGKRADSNSALDREFEQRKLDQAKEIAMAQIAASGAGSGAAAAVAQKANLERAFASAIQAALQGGQLQSNAILGAGRQSVSPLLRG